jgi:hypothetical protein
VVLRGRTTSLRGTKLFALKRKLTKTPVYVLSVHVRRGTARCVRGGWLFLPFPSTVLSFFWGRGRGRDFSPVVPLSWLSDALSHCPPPPASPTSLRCGTWGREGERGAGGRGRCGGLWLAANTHTHTHPPISLWRQIPLSPPQPAVSHAGIGRRAEVAARTSHAAAPPSVRVLPLPSCRRCRCRRHQTPRSDDIRRRVSLWRRRL